jgi:osmotically-inducible protein OsmY
MKTDSELQKDVLEELKWDPQVEHTQIGVTTKNGIVTLTGFVPNYSQKMAAEKATRRVFGVKAIAEEIEVRFPTDPRTTDAQVAQRILDIFKWDVSIPDDKFAVKVEHGLVTLTGKAAWNFQKVAAGKAAGRVLGVKAVTNLIDVDARPSTYDVRERIMSAFKRSSAIDASAIKVSVQDGTVRLSGRVHGWNERKVAENAAWAASGVTKVEDDIVLA